MVIKGVRRWMASGLEQRVGEEVAVLNAVLVGHRGQRFALLHDRPEQEARAIESLGSAAARGAQSV